MAKGMKKHKLEPLDADGFSTNWEIDYYKTDHESDEHWELRRRFMEAYKNKFPEDQLVCLAQVFVNMEFMGCKYPSETMRMVAELSKDVAKDFREDRKGRLKRTFVAASDAAEMRAKARTTKKDLPGRKCLGFGNWAQEQGHEETQQNVCKSVAEFFKKLPFKNFVLSIGHYRSALASSAARSKVKHKEVETGTNQKTISVYLDDKFVAKGTAGTAKEARDIAVRAALQILQKKCFSIKINPASDKITISKKDGKIDLNVIQEKSETVVPEKIDSNNIGFKMMKSMGWTGGGLGAQTQGRVEPVGYLLKNNRQGLGATGHSPNHAGFKQILQNYITSPDVRELRFESSFTKEERAVVHSLATPLGLISRSYGKDEKRFLTIKKKIDDAIILNEVLLNKSPIYCNQYLVQVPESLALHFPEYTKNLEIDYN